MVEVSAMRCTEKGNYNSLKRYIATARCAPEDEFSLSTGVALVMDRLSKLLDADIKVGNEVKIVDVDKAYPTCTSWLTKNLDDINDIARYSYGSKPIDSDTRFYKVLAIAPHSSVNDKKLAYVELFNGITPCYLIDIDGLEKV